MRFLGVEDTLVDANLAKTVVSTLGVYDDRTFTMVMMVMVGLAVSSAVCMPAFLSVESMSICTA